MKTKDYIHSNRKAIIVLHEIYGVNLFIKKVCKYYYEKDYDIYCPDLFDGAPHFQYTQSEEAYNYFTQNVGFDIYQEVNLLISRLKTRYDKVFIIGFSIGATIAWRCSENTNCDAVVCYYGSRIRDYLTVTPQCPSLLLFAQEDSFDVMQLADKIEQKENVLMNIIEGKHGFMDCYSDRYQQVSSKKAIEMTEKFLMSDKLIYL